MNSTSKRWSAICAATVFATGAAMSGTYVWDSDGADPLTDGTGNWAATGGQNWFDGVSVYGAWGNTTGDIAVFGVANGAAGTVSVGTVTANGITFNPPGSGAYTLSGGTVTLGGTTPTITANTNAVVGSALAGTSLTKSGAGTLTLSGGSRYSGNTTVSGGTLKITGGIYTNAHSQVTLTVQNGGVLELNSWYYGASQSLGMFTADTGNFIVNNGTIRMNGSSSYGRGVTLNGPVTLEAAAGANWTLNTTVDNRAWIYNNNAIELAGAGTGTFEKPISGGGALTKNGSGVWTLSSSTNSYSGATLIKAGTLKLAATGSISNSPSIDVAGGAVYDVSSVSGYTARPGQTLSGDGMVAGGVSIAGGGVLAAGGTNATGTLSFSADLTLADKTVADWNYGDGAQDVIAVAGTLTLPTVATVNVSRVTGTLPPRRRFVHLRLRRAKRTRPEAVGRQRRAVRHPCRGV